VVVVGVVVVVYLISGFAVNYPSSQHTVVVVVVVVVVYKDLAT
jgi:hypothetical protein